MEQIDRYFNAEKIESAFFVLIGIAALGFAFYFLFFVKKPFQTGMAYPIAVIALIQLVVGTSVYFRSPKDLERVTQMVQHQDSKIQTEEIPRMEVVQKNFIVYKYIEIALLVGGGLVILMTRRELLLGIGTGLVVQSSIMLLLDLVAEARASTYLHFLRSLG